jgi:hypothetical protein
MPSVLFLKLFTLRFGYFTLEEMFSVIIKCIRSSEGHHSCYNQIYIALRRGKI